ncbi:hypothetical protein MVEN_01093700 [Mycena venus]|uniref:F-box domain-containing protein n=1 Tax=Mycena venus TaxID=2733690 RepID=A0A8H6Y924_9AGAR|nr:hypothetical protein MVEN_01093700 [Mycena venus]
MASKGDNMSSPTLPLEIQFLILDRVRLDNGRIDRKELRRMAFVCLSWAGHIESLLFRGVDLGDTHALAQRYLSLFHRNNRLGRYTTRLSLQPDIAFDYPDLQTFLPNVCTVIVSGCIMGPLKESSRPWSTVRRLCIRFCLLSTAGDLWRLIGLFPALERLEFSGWLMPETPETLIGGAIDIPAIHLKHLVLESFRNNSPHSVALQLALHELTVERVSITLEALDHDASPLNTLLSKIGPSVQHLELTELPADMTPVVGISIRPCTALRGLTLSLRFSTDSPQDMKAGLITLLGQIRSPMLAMLSLRVSLTVPLLELPWEEVDRILAGSLYPELRRVVVGVLVSDAPSKTELCSSFDELAMTLNDKMVGLVQRRLLHFERGDL